MTTLKFSTRSARGRCRALLAALPSLGLALALSEPAYAQTPGNMPVPYTSIAAAPNSTGYWTQIGDGGTRAVLGAPFYGTIGGRAWHDALVVARPSGKGYWAINRSTGEIVNMGDAPSLCGGQLKNCGADLEYARDAAATATGEGLWVLDRRGEVWTAGDAVHHGDVTNDGWTAGIAAAPSGRGYYIAMTNGAVHARGSDVPFYGSTGGNGDGYSGIALSTTAGGQVNGYWLVGLDGGVHTFGGARFHGSTGGNDGGSPVTGIAAPPGGGSYAIVHQDGRVQTMPNGSPDVRRAKRYCRAGSGDCSTRFPFKLQFKNDSSQAVRLTLHTSSATGDGQGSGFLHEVIDQIPTWPDTSIRVEPGASTPLWALGIMLGTVQGESARMQIDVQSVDDDTTRQRLEINQSRWTVLHNNGTLPFGFAGDVEVLGPPELRSTGAGTVTASLAETVSHEGTFAGTWTVTLGDPVWTTTGAADVTIKRLTGERRHDPPIGGLEQLDRPIYRLDVGATTRTWPGGLPARVTAEPALVEGYSVDPLTGEGRWKELGKLQSTAAPTVDRSAKTVRFGASSMYFQNADGTAVGVSEPIEGEQYVMNLDGTGDSLITTAGDRAALGGFEGKTRAANAWRLRETPNTPGMFQIVDAEGKCLTVIGGNGSPANVLRRECSMSDGAWLLQRWRLERVGDGNRFRLKGLDGVLGMVNGQLSNVKENSDSAEGQSWTFLDPAAKPPINYLRVRGGWTNRTEYSPRIPVGAPAPTIKVPNDVALGSLDLTPDASGTPAIVSNGLDSESMTVSMAANGKVFGPDHPALGELYDLIYFQDGNGRLLTGLDAQPAAVSRLGSWNGRAGARDRLFLSTTAERANQFLSFEVAVGGELWESNKNVEFTGVKELARVGTESTLSEGVPLSCSTDGSTFTNCDPATGIGSLYRDLAGNATLATRYFTIASVSDPDYSPDSRPGMFSGDAWKTSGMRVTGGLPGHSHGAFVELSLITPRGTIARASMIKTTY